MSATCRPTSSSVRWSRSTPRRWACGRIATGSAWSSSRPATATVHLVRFAGGGYHAPNLVRLLGDPAVEKVFHFARFDLAILRHHLGVVCRPVYCTKIASKLARTYTDRHGLKDLCQDLLGIDLSKQLQSSDWGAAELSEAQLSYAANDVLHLHRLRERLNAMLEREGRRALAAACFDFLPERVELDLSGWADVDIFAY